MRFLTRGLLTLTLAMALCVGAYGQGMEKALDEIEAALQESQQAYLSGDLRLGWDAGDRALRLARDLEPSLLEPPDTVAEKRRRADVLTRLAEAARGRLQEPKELAYLTKSIELYGQATGRSSPELAEALFLLADLKLRAGNREAWQSLMEQALEIRIDVYGPHHSEVAYLWSVLGNQAAADGDLDAAKTYLQRAVDSLEASVPSTDLDLGHTYLELARVLKARGEETRAQRFEERGSAILRMHHG